MLYLYRNHQASACMNRQWSSLPFGIHRSRILSLFKQVIHHFMLASQTNGKDEHIEVDEFESTAIRPD